MRPRPTTEPAAAKINLTLHVTGQRQDGYHLLDSLVMFADIGDRVTVGAGTPALHVQGPFAAGVPVGPDNLVMRAAALIGAEVAVTLDKQLPVAAGIGGGSSDAAACLRAVSRMTGRSVPGDLMPLGADVPVCLLARAARLRGIGEDVTPIPSIPTLDAVLVNPGVGVSTPEIFRHLENRHNCAMPTRWPHFGTAETLTRWLATQRNDLEGPATAVAPVIEEVLRHIAATKDCGLARMSGSGATCYGLYPDPSRAAAAARMLSRTRPDWWIAPCRLS